MSIYKKGARKEYHIIYKLRKRGFDIVQRTAGSNSPIDIIAVDKKNKIIKFIQSKRVLEETMNYTDQKLKEKIEKENQDLTGIFKVEFEVK